MAFEASEEWQRVFLVYRVEEEGSSSGNQTFLTAEMRHIGGNYWYTAVDAPDDLYAIHFWDGEEKSTLASQVPPTDWDKGICFRQADRSYRSNPLLFFDFVDRYGWLDNGSDEVLFSTFASSLGSLPYVVRGSSSDELNKEAEIYQLDKSGLPTSDGNGKLYHYALVNPHENDTPCLWMRRQACESDAIIAEITDGAVITQQSAPCPTPLYAYYTMGSGYDFDKYIPVPYRNGEYVVDWQFAKGKRDKTKVQILFSLGHGPVADILAGGLRIADNTSGTSDIDGYKVFTQVPVGLNMNFSTTEGKDPTLQFPNDNSCTPSGNYPFFGRISISFEEGMKKGTMRFTGIPERPIATELAQTTEDETPAFGFSLAAGWKESSKFTLSDGRTANEAIKGVALRSADSRVVAELARSIGKQVDTDNAFPSVVIDDAAFLNALKNGETATLEFPSVRPDLIYHLWLDPIPDDRVDLQEWRAPEMDRRDTDSFHSSTAKIEIQSPGLIFSDIAYRAVDVPEHLQQPSGGKPGIGHAVPVYPRAVTTETVCEFNPLPQLPAGWSAKLRLIDIDGDVVAETSSNTVTLQGLTSSNKFDLRAVYAVSNGESEVCSPASFRPEELPAGNEIPSYSFNGNCIYVFNRSPIEHPEKVGAVYDLVLEHNLNIENPEGLPLCLDFEVVNSDEKTHSGHLAEGQSNEPRLTNADETYDNLDGSIRIYGNTSLRAGDPEWQYRLAEAGRAVAFIHHFHCEGSADPATKYPETKVTSRARLMMPILVPDKISEVTAGGSSRRALQAAESTGSRLDLMEIPMSGNADNSITTEIPLTDIDKIATGVSVAKDSAESEAEQLYDLQGRHLPTPPVHGTFIQGSRIIRK